MKRILIALFTALALTQVADAQLIRRSVRGPEASGHWELIGNRWEWVSNAVLYSPKTAQSVSPAASQQADKSRPSGRVRDFIKRLLGR